MQILLLPRILYHQLNSHHPWPTQEHNIKVPDMYVRT